MESEKSSKWRGIIFQARNISAVLGGIWIIILIIQFGVSLFKKDYDITATVETSPFYIPDNIIGELDSLKIAFQPDSIQKFFPKDKLDYNSVQSNISDYLGEKLLNLDAVIKQVSNSHFPYEQWIFKITNEGTKEINDLTLNLPNKGYYKLIQPGDEHSYSSFAQMINLGSLRPSNEIVVIVWNHSDPYLRYYLDKIKITHPNGVVDVQYYEKVLGILGWLYFNRGILPFMIPLGLAAILLVSLRVWLFMNKCKEGKKEVNDTNFL